MAGVCCSSVGELWRMVLARLGWLVCSVGELWRMGLARLGWLVCVAVVVRSIHLLVF